MSTPDKLTEPDWLGPNAPPASLRRGEIAQAAEARRRYVDDQVLAAEAALEPTDRSRDAEYLREVAGSIRDHRADHARREEFRATQQVQQTATAATPGAVDHSADQAAAVRRAYLEQFQARARQLAAEEFAEQWYQSGITARDAADWANAGFTPSEAHEHIAAGRAPSDFRDDGAWFTHAADHPPRLTQFEAVELTEAARDHGEPHTQRYAQQLLDRYHTLRQLPAVHDQAAADPDQLHDVLEEMRRLVDSQRHHLQQAADTAAAQLRARDAIDQLNRANRHHADDSRSRHHTSYTARTEGDSHER